MHRKPGKASNSLTTSFFNVILIELFQSCRRKVYFRRYIFQMLSVSKFFPSCYYSVSHSIQLCLVSITELGDIHVYTYRSLILPIISAGSTTTFKCCASSLLWIKKLSKPIPDNYSEEELFMILFITEHLMRYRCQIISSLRKLPRSAPSIFTDTLWKILFQSVLWRTICLESRA